jgi:hypothetical protein
MPTTFDVISLGNLADIDTIEGNNLAENASALVGLTFGGVGDPLFNDFVSFSPVGDPGSAYDQDNSPADQFSIDGGAAQTFDSVIAINATITYTDGTTATITAVVFQDTSGNTYMAPEFSNNADQVALEAGAIRSITFDSIAVDSASGLRADREIWDFVTCFTRGTLIETENGPVAVEDITVGDKIMTVDRGLQSLCWIGSRTVQATGVMAPVMIRKGALGNTRDLLVSPQHRMLLSGWRAELYMGTDEVLVAAKHLVNDKTICVQNGGEVEYFHIMFDQHELVYAAGIASESFNPGSCAMDALSKAAREEILTLFPELRHEGIAAYGDTVRPTTKAHEARLLRA